LQTLKLIDYHLHTIVTVDGKMTEDQACERAILMGMQEIAFTNHIMLTEPDYSMSHESFVKHWEQIQSCQQRYPELTIRLGLEIDYYDGREKEITDTIQQYEDLIRRPFDLVLGAVHHMKGVFFSSKFNAPELFNNYEIVELYHDYFTLATKAIKSHLFDVMAHPDLIKKFMGVFSPSVPFEHYRTAVGSYVEALLACGVGIEVNTKGFEQRGGEAYPSDDLLELYISKAKAQGREPIITLGSDAHKIADVGRYIMDGAMTLQKLGQGTIMSFEKRKVIPFQL
jgi:histidinol-phosphatase (PHP family)